MDVDLQPVDCVRDLGVLINSGMALVRLLLHFPDEILDPVCMLFEKSLREGRVPEDWRRAIVVPIYKAGDRGKAKNYRPVSLTCQLCKLFEKLVRDEMVEHLEANGLLKGTQHGFRSE